MSALYRFFNCFLKELLVILNQTSVRFNPVVIVLKIFLHLVLFEFPAISRFIPASVHQQLQRVVKCFPLKSLDVFVVDAELGVI
eukprot:m.419724 g.419724  ORF g.419724 m.419724 type:complete len:84 (+) comp16842_c0_seq8:2969-3220(+)